MATTARIRPLPFTATHAFLSLQPSLLLFLLGLSTFGGLEIHTNGVRVFPKSLTRITNSHSLGQQMPQSGDMSSKDAAGFATLAVHDAVSIQTDAKDPKSSRSKERRRRGKDPLKDLLKGGKKSKSLTKSIKSVELDGNEVGSSITLPEIKESLRSHRPRELSLTSSSRSASTASTSDRRTPPPNSNWADPYPRSDQSIHEDNDVGAASSSTPMALSSLSASSQDQKVPDFHKSDHSLQLDPLTHPQSPTPPNISLSTSSSTSYSSSSNLGITPNTSPTLSLSDKTPTLVQAGDPYPSPRAPANPVTTSTSLLPIQKDPGLWDWCTASSSSTSDNALRKPPRFRSGSRGSASSSVSPPALASKPVVTFDSESTLLLTSGSAGSHEDGHPFTFPTLNSSSSPLSKLSNRVLNHATSNGNGHPNMLPPSVSTQTQLASLRGDHCHWK